MVTPTYTYTWVRVERGGSCICTPACTWTRVGVGTRVPVTSSSIGILHTAFVLLRIDFGGAEYRLPMTMTQHKYLCSASNSYAVYTNYYNLDTLDILAVFWVPEHGHATRYCYCGVGSCLYSIRALSWAAGDWKCPARHVPVIVYRAWFWRLAFSVKRRRGVYQAQFR